MKHESIKYFNDMLDSIDLIYYHVRNIASLKEFEKDKTAVDAVERRLAIIGEALNMIKKIDPVALQITNYKKIIGLRHIIVHNYDLIDHASLWIVVRKHLPILKNEIEIILNSA